MADHEESVPSAESAESSEAKAESPEADFESPEAAARLAAEASGEVKELESGGLPIAEKAAEKLGVEVDLMTEAEIAEIGTAAREALTELTIVLEQSERKETVEESHEYRDAEGRLLGKAVLEFAAQGSKESAYKATDGTPGICRKLLSFKMQGERDGQKTETDLMALAKTGDTEIWVGTKRMKNYYSRSSEKTVTSPPLETPFDVAVLLHELGHADQAREDRFKAIEGLSNDEEDRAKYSLSGMQQVFEEVRASFPEAGPYIDQVDMTALKEITARADRKLDEQVALDRLKSRAEGEKQDVLRETIMKAFEKGGDFEDFIGRVYDASAEERASLLEGAGFEFSDEALPPEKESMSFTFGERDEEPPAPLPREALSDYGKARELLAGVQRTSLEDERTYDAASGKLILTLPISVRSQAYNARLSLDLGPEEHLAMTERLAAKDVEIAGFHGQVEKAGAELAVINQEFDAKQKEMRVPQIINLGRNTRERDATRRAFQWMRTLRQDGGVDLFAAGRASREVMRMPEEEDCEEDVGDELSGNEGSGEVVSDPKAYLQKALRTYGADKFRLKNSGDPDDIGVMPKPGSDRK